MPKSVRKAPGIGTHNDARIIAVVGASGMGKGATTKAEILPERKGPAVIWSPLEETDDYARVIGGTRVKSLAAVIDEWRAGRSVVYEPPLNPKTIGERFDLFCRAAWYMPGALIVVEELSRVTTPSWAPGAWKNLSTAGRHRGVTLVGTCQRPAQVDKDFFGNCSEIRCFRVNYENDARVMATVLRVSFERVLELEKLHYIRRDINARTNALCVVGQGVIPEKGQESPPISAAKQKKAPPAVPKIAANRRDSRKLQR